MGVRCIWFVSIVFFFSLSAKEKNCDLTILGPVCMADGLNRQSVLLAKTVQDTLRISFLSPTSLKARHLVDVPHSIRHILRRSGKKYPGKVLFFESMLTREPKNLPYKGGFWKRFTLSSKRTKQIRIAYSMFETSKIAREWVEILNKEFDAVCVPDIFLKEVYKNSGVQIPIFTLPLGIDLEDFLKIPIKKKRNNKTVFANFCSCTPRKNLVRLLQAFHQAFGNNQDVELLLGWRYADKKVRKEIVQTISQLGLKNVKIVESAVGQKEYVHRFSQIDCYVNVALGEGFSVQPREAMALGIPTIITNNTAQHTICNSGLVFSVPSQVPVSSLQFYPYDLGFFYDCEVSDLAQGLKDVYDHYDTYLKQSPAMRKWAAAYHYANTKPAYLTMIKPKHVFLGPENQITEVGLMTTSQKLLKKYQRILHICPKKKSESSIRD